MPRYEYECRACGHLESQWVPMEQRNARWDCTTCGTGNGMAKILSRPHVAAIAGIPNRIGREIEGV